MQREVNENMNPAEVGAQTAADKSTTDTQDDGNGDEDEMSSQEVVAKLKQVRNTGGLELSSVCADMAQRARIALSVGASLRDCRLRHRPGAQHAHEFAARRDCVHCHTQNMASSCVRA
jgi:hypothetical protein